MSQLPPDPTQPSPAGSYRMAPTQTNGWGLASLITSIVGFCGFGLGGLLGIIFGFLGIRRSKETHTGYGASLAGIIIGVVNLLFWAIFGTAVLAAIGIGGAAVKKLAEAPRNATAAFIGDLSKGDLTAAASKSNGLGEDQLQSLSDSVKSLGPVKQINSSNFNYNNGSVSLQGTVTFEKGQRSYTAQLTGNEGNGWVVQNLTISP